jgi:nitric oxide synthase-interacting protein
MQANERPSKLHPICPASTPSTKHSYFLKTLTTVHFNQEKGSKAEDSIRTCPACKKDLSNSSKAILAKPCGHVLCGSCVEKFMKPPETPHAHEPDSKEKHGKVSCYVCETEVTEQKRKPGMGKEGKEKLRPGLLEISCEGTGFAGGGMNMTKREGVSFQC